MIMESIVDLFYNGGRDREFAIVFVGSYDPPLRPHRADWKIADGHWIDYSQQIFESRAIPPKEKHAAAIRRAKDYAIGILLTEALLGLCPICPGTVPGPGGRS